MKKLTPNQAEVLTYLHRGKALDRAELARLTDAPAEGVSITASSLVRNGYATKATRRGVVVYTITVAGQTAINNHIPASISSRLSFIKGMA